MNKNTLFLISGLVVLVFVAAMILLQQESPSNVTPTFETSNNSANLLSSPVETPEPLREGPSFVREVVEANNTIESCYVIYGNYVYLIPPSWADEHEGGSDEITDSCGKDITELFNDNSEHTSDASDMLDSFYLGKFTD